MFWPITEAFKEELEWLQQQDIIASIGMDEVQQFHAGTKAEWKGQILP